ncbi:hypothetical protein BJY01DRAFT_352 [Aspergillus pseudoustus]|uniref:Ysc84 actin-binding domain-containing protein n=1 Tax=Aspergillus pseudoustus TaxID=1810923 RepID=A0ABR4L1S3_9EURO
MPKGMHNPLPASLRSECIKATQILDSFINGSWRGSPGRELPERVLANAKGLAILTVTKAGILGSLRFGSGILLARLDDENNTWSHPSAIGTAGLGFGGQAGFELADFVFILNDADSLATFSRLGSLTLSGNFSIAFGPLGRNAEIAGGVSASGGGKMMSFCKTKGLFGGVSVESGVIVERRGANRRFYGRKVTAAQILKGEARAQEGGDVEELMKVLQEVFAPRATGVDENGQVGQAEGEGEGEREGVGQGQGQGQESQESHAVPQLAVPEPTPGLGLELEPELSGSRSREQPQTNPSEPQNKAPEASA